MTANVLEHRRAKAFAEALEAHQESSGGDSHRSGSAAMAGLLAIADSLGGLPEPELGLEARTVQRAQLMAAFEQQWAGGQPTAPLPRQRRHRAARVAPHKRWSRRLAIGGLIAGVAVGSFAGAATASTNALPGDALYGMKRGLEGLRLDFAGSDSERGALLLEQATTRLDEAQSLLKRSGATDGLSPDTIAQVRQALDDMHAEAVRGRDLLRSVYRANGSLSPLQKLANFADEDGRWNDVHGRLPAGLTPQASKVDQLFDDISEDVAPFHLEKQPGQGGAPGTAGSSGGQQSPASNGATQDGTPGSANTPSSHGTNGAAPHGGSAPGNAPGSVGGLVSNLTSGLTGGGTTSPSPGQPSPSASPTPDGQGLTIPPLIPGLLPGITLN